MFAVKSIISTSDSSSKNYIKIYDSDKFGADYKVLFKDLDRNEEFEIISNANLFNFVDCHCNEIIGCNKRLFNKFVSYSLSQFDDMDLQLLDLITYVGTEEKENTKLKSFSCIIDIKNLCCNVYGNLFKLMLMAFINSSTDDLNNYHFNSKTKLLECNQFYILDDYLYVLVDNNSVNVYKIKDSKKFFGLFAKCITFKSKFFDDMFSKERMHNPELKRKIMFC